MNATKEETIAAGTEMMNQATEAQKQNHLKVIEWIKTLKNVPTTADPKTTYKECCNEWVAVHIKNQPAGTGSYNLETM